MIQNIQIVPHQISTFSAATINFSENESNFPLLQLDKDSYIVCGQIQTTIELDESRTYHNLQLGKYNSLADSITFLINLDHDYLSVYQGCVTALQEFDNKEFRKLRKGQILIQNDCWVGHGATIMGGVTIHNGAIVAANSVVTKDVPPYAIVAGNPAKIVKYRFTEEQIADLQTISWWNWSEEEIIRYKEDFVLPIDEFIDKHIERYRKDLAQVDDFIKTKTNKNIILVTGDVDCNYPLYKRAIELFFEEEVYRNSDLIIYIPEVENIDLINVYDILEKYADLDCDVIVQTEKLADERSLFKSANYYVTNRGNKNILYTGYCDLFNVKILSGADSKIYKL